MNNRPELRLGKPTFAHSEWFGRTLSGRQANL